jgi:hypothetical protein
MRLDIQPFHSNKHQALPLFVMISFPPNGIHNAVCQIPYHIIQPRPYQPTSQPRCSFSPYPIIIDIPLTNWTSPSLIPRTHACRRLLQFIGKKHRVADCCVQNHLILFLALCLSRGHSLDLRSWSEGGIAYLLAAECWDLGRYLGMLAHLRCKLWREAVPEAGWVVERRALYCGCGCGIGC